MLFDFDQQLFSSRPYLAMIRKTVRLTIGSPNKHAPGPEEIITSITSDATGSVEPTPPLIPGIYSQHPARVQKTPKVILLGKLACRSTHNTLPDHPQGQGESSKSTFLKQMQCIYDSGFSMDERKEWRAIIYENLVNTLDALLLLLENDSARGDLVSGSSHVNVLGC
jgi:hypothetical protein